MSAVAELPVTAPVAAPESAQVPAAAQTPLQRLSKLTRTQRIRLGAGVGLLVVALIAAIVLNTKTEYRVLYSSLSEKDGGAIIAQLTQMNIPYQYTEGGGAIMVPSDRVHDLRLRLAAQGLPKGSVAGFEAIDSGRFGVTQFQERLNFQRGLEGELTRSITALSAVDSARVHLALPNQNGFFREQQKPSASVLLTLYPGRILDRAQIAGIVHLVAASVPEMTPSAVSILDSNGNLLSQSPDQMASAAVDAQQLRYVQELEKTYTQRILDILEPVVGKDNVKAQVTTEVDFSQTDSTSEQHRPNQQPDAGVVRSQQVVEAVGNGVPPLPTGVPGATSNQPPQTAGAPINGQAQPLAAANNMLQGGQPPGTKRESITNYEVDKTVRVTRGSSGAIRRVTAAVVVNYQPNADGEVQALSPEQIAQMTALVRETIGFSAERGDSVNLMNAQFQQGPDAGLPFWKQAETLELARSLAWPLGLGLFAAVMLLWLVRPVIQALNPEPPAPVVQQLDALESEELDRPALPAPDNGVDESKLRLEDARALVRQNPVAVANIVKTWINRDSV